ncbi:unnamed protein product, partial [Prorocentrum cordatum]
SRRAGMEAARGAVAGEAPCRPRSARMPRGCALRAALLAGSVFRAGAAAPPWRRVLDHGEVRGFPSYEAANALLDTWVKEQPGVLRRQEIGHSYEQRPIHAYVLAANASESQGRPKVLLTSLMHAREPASLTVVLNFLGRILELYSSGDPEAASVMSARELWLVPPPPGAAACRHLPQERG